MKQGIIFIPDISGFSRFVKETDIASGAVVTAALLNVLINANRLFKIAEIEGDAILFYRQGDAYPVKSILQQFNEMLRAFNAEKETLQKVYPQVNSLSLKLIVHYGSIEEFSVKGYSKLYGSTLVEAHRLLKNNIPLDSYVLITDAYLEGSDYLQEARHPAAPARQCELYGDVGKICYAFFPYSSLKLLAA